MCLVLNLEWSRIHESTVDNEHDNIYYRYNTRSSDEIKQTLREAIYTNCFTQLENYFGNIEININDIMTRFMKIVYTFIDSCKHNTRKINTKRVHPVWFDFECSEKKHIKYRQLKTYRNDKTDHNLQNYLVSRSEFRSTINKKKQIHKDINVKILLQNLNNPKTFWNKLKLLAGDVKPKAPKITTDRWYEYFENLFDVKENESS